MEPVNSMMVDAASKSKIVEEDEFDDTDEVLSGLLTTVFLFF